MNIIQNMADKFLCERTQNSKFEALHCNVTQHDFMRHEGELCRERSHPPGTKGKGRKKEGKKKREEEKGKRQKGKWKREQIQKR
jgi:hypothetical protein